MKLTISLTTKGKQSDSVRRSQSATDKSNGTLTFNGIHYPHITPGALKSYESAAKKGNVLGDPNQSWSKMARPAAADYQFRANESSVMKCIYLTYGRKGLTLEFLANSGTEIMRLDRFTKEKLNSFLIDEQDPRHVSSHLRTLSFNHNHYYKRDHSIWTDADIIAILEKAKKHGLIGAPMSRHAARKGQGPGPAFEDSEVVFKRVRDTFRAGLKRT